MRLPFIPFLPTPPEGGWMHASGKRNFEIGRGPLLGSRSNLEFRISDLRCRIRPISNFSSGVLQMSKLQHAHPDRHSGKPFRCNSSTSPANVQSRQGISWQGGITENLFISAIQNILYSHNQIDGGT